jgi:hypothetical protein
MKDLKDPNLGKNARIETSGEMAANYIREISARSRPRGG